MPSPAGPTPPDGPVPTGFTAEWLRGEGADADVVISSRVRLARNLADEPFPGRASAAQKKKVLGLCRPAVLDIPGHTMVWIDLHDTSPFERTLLMERHLISKQHAKGKAKAGESTPEGSPRAVAVAADERFSVMVNEEDHLRLQAIRSGLALRQAWEDADAADDAIESHVELAFSPRFGYVTACPTNVGTGLRMSVMMHLPALRLMGDIEKVKRAAADMNLAVRGFYGEHSDASGDFYQLSNQATLGKSERIILRELQDEIIPRVIEFERAARKTLADKRRTLIEDQVYRALGLLTHARMISTEDAMQGLSMVRLGSTAGVLPQLDRALIGQLMLMVQPGHLQRLVGQAEQERRMVARATLLRQRLA
ncbi:MAG: protein arginine kinase [Phycisphaerae bacterium]|nr:protein arginine kinase [Phycisphaerae bacterium]